MKSLISTQSKPAPPVDRFNLQFTSVMGSKSSKVIDVDGTDEFQEVSEAPQKIRNSSVASVKMEERTAVAQTSGAVMLQNRELLSQLGQVKLRLKQTIAGYQQIIVK